MNLAAGIITKKNKSEILERMINSINFFGDKTCKAAAGDFAAGWISKEIYAAKSAEFNNVIVIILGNIFKINCKLIKNNNFEVKEIFDLFEKTGTALGNHIEGEFNIVIYDSNKAELFLFNDRFGLIPLYYYFKNGLFMFASKFKAFFQNPDFEKKLDKTGIIEYLTFEYPLEDRTYFENIKLLPSASALKFIGTDISIIKYWHIKFSENISYSNTNEYIEKHNSVLSESVKKRIPANNKSALFLSGGLDSRMIAAQLYANKTAAETYTYGRSEEQLDYKFASKIAETLNFKSELIKISENIFVENLERHTYFMEGMAPRSVVVLPFHKAKQNSGSTFFWGYFGDDMYGAYYDKTVPSDNFNHLSDYILKANYMKNLDDISELINKDFAKDYTKTISNSIFEIVKTISSEYPDRYCKLYFNLFQRQRKMVSGDYLASSLFSKTAIPFTDYDFVDFMTNLPFEYLLNQKLEKETLKTSFPSLAKIPWQHTHCDLFASNFKIKLNSKLIKTQIMFRRFTEMISSGKYSYNLKHFEYPEEYWTSVNPQKKFISDILSDSKSLSAEYIDKKGLQNCLDKHFRGISNYSRLIYTLLSLEFLRRQLNF